MTMAVRVSPPPVYPGSMPRSCQRADGTPKREYLTRDEARRGARLFHEADLQAYRCPYGEHYHVGRARKVRAR